MIFNKWLFATVLVSFAFMNNDILEFYIAILKNTNISSFIVSLISGLFGFIIAVIPFAIQMLSNKESKFVESLLKKENFDFLIKPMFGRLIAVLKLMVVIFAFILALSSMQTVEINLDILRVEFIHISIKRYIALGFFYFYIVLGVSF